jgi:hypothetical protein
MRFLVGSTWLGPAFHCPITDGIIGWIAGREISFRAILDKVPSATPAVFTSYASITIQRLVAIIDVQPNPRQFTIVHNSVTPAATSA